MFHFLNINKYLYKLHFEMDAKQFIKINSEIRGKVFWIRSTSFVESDDQVHWII